MSYKLCTAEKPSVAGEIAHVLGANKKCNGYYEGNGYRVTWAVGHLVGLAEPDLYGYMTQSEIWDKENLQNRQIALEQLPLIPSEFKLIVIEQTKQQFEIMKKLMNDPECSEIIDCGDAGAEGHILQWFIRVKAGCQKPVKRFIATSMTEEAISESMKNLKNINDYTSIIKGEFCKKKADWIMGMSMSRCASIIYNAKVDVGRVQSPTLYFIVQRYLLVNSFVPKDYFQMQVEFTEGFKTGLIFDNYLFPPSVKDDENRIIVKDIVRERAKELKDLGVGVISALETKNKSTDRPQLYDITELERDGNRIYGYTADEVLKTSQSLYETHKITTYPRTDSRYITSDLEPYMIQRIKDIQTHSFYEPTCKSLVEKGLSIDKKIVDDSKVTDHHAILVTEKINGFNLEVLSEIEKNILHLVITRMLVAFSDKYKYKETIINVSFSNGMIFGASGKMPVSYGWKNVQKLLMGKIEMEEDEENEEEQFFSNLSLNQKVIIKDVFVLDKKTTPPKLHTEATLLTAMENAGSQLENGAILKGKGIGTQSTRAGIIKQLFDKGYVTNSEKGKTKYIIPTKQGISVIKVLPKELYSPKITANWEEKISDIVNGKCTEKDFMNEFISFIQDKVSEVKNNKVQNVDFSVDRISLGHCPWCKSPVYEGKYKDKDSKIIESAYCSNKECLFSIKKDNVVYVARTGHKLKSTQLKTLVEKGVLTAKCKSKSDSTYTGQFKVIKNEKGYASLIFDFDDKKQKQSSKPKRAKL